MRYIHCAVLGMALLCTSSCHSSRADVQGAAGANNQTQSEVTFEIKNLTWTSTPRKSILTPSKTESWDYKAHAIITTRASSLQQGVTVVGFEYRATPPSTSATQEWDKDVSLLTDGTGELDFTIYYDADHYKENPGPPKLEWRVLGYVPLVPGKISVE
jgi:hypothetical protein